MHTEFSNTPFGQKVTYKEGDEVLWTEYVQLFPRNDHTWIPLAVLVLMTEFLIRVSFRIWSGTI